MSPEVAQKWRQNGVKMAKRGGNGVFEQKPQRKRQRKEIWRQMRDSYVF
jgi:hypothetical protein